MKTKPIKRAVELAGGQAALARIVGVTQPTVWAWLRKGEMPAEYVLATERATGISRHALRPDIYPRDEVKAA